MNLLVSFSAWAELVWRYLLKVTNTVNPSSIPGSTQKKIVLTRTLTLTLTLTLTRGLAHTEAQPFAQWLTEDQYANMARFDTTKDGRLDEATVTLTLTVTITLTVTQSVTLTETLTLT